MEDYRFACQRCHLVNENPDIKENEDWEDWGEGVQEKYQALKEVSKVVNSEWEGKKEETKTVTKVRAFRKPKRETVPKYESLREYLNEEYPELSEDLMVLGDSVEPNFDILKKKIEISLGANGPFYFSCSLCGKRSYIPKNPEEE